MKIHFKISQLLVPLDEFYEFGFLSAAYWLFLKNQRSFAWKDS